MASMYTLIIDWLLHQLPVKYPYALFLYIPLIILTIWLIRRNFVRFHKKEEELEYLKTHRGMRRFMVIARLITFLLLMIAVASPFRLEEKVVKGDLSLTLLTDTSDSFQLFDTTVAGKLKTELERYIPVNMVEIASDKRSAIGDGILNHIKGDDSVLLITDGNNNIGHNLGDVMLLAANLNTTISALDLQPIKKDTTVVLKGPRSSIVGSDVTLTAEVTQVGGEQPYTISIEIDGNKILEQSASGTQDFTITKQLGEGYHRVTAKVTIDDTFPENNVHYKIVQIVPKPTIAFVTRKTSPLTGQLSEIYHVKVMTELPSNPEEYMTIILNDIPMTAIPRENVDALTDYITEGGGMVVIGGENSYDLGGYKDSLFETLLPVKSGVGEKEPEKKVNVVVVIDISGSTGSLVGGIEGESKLGVQKALAVNILRDVRAEDNVGVVAFNAEGFIISILSPIADKRDPLIDLVSSLQFGGGTDVSMGLREAEKLLLNAQGSKNIILISDGVTMQPEVALARTVAGRTGGITTYSVGVGQDTDEVFMRQIAQLGNGIYFKANEATHLKILFGEPEDDEKEKRNLVVLNGNHFITKELSLSGQLTGYNQVVPKASASALVTTGTGAPLLTVWRFGLGRVAALASDDGSKYAAPLLARENSKLITRSINWAVGDPTKTRGFGVIAEDTNLGKTAEITVRSKQLPQSDLMQFKKVDVDLYRGFFSPAETGFFSLAGAEVAVNYYDELQKIGMHPNLRNLVMATGGEMFKPDQIEEIIKKTKASAMRKETQEISYRWPFALAALCLFLFEVCVRKLHEKKVL
ncbi:VWA domain-containing protein [Candidatus Woesearchaeota archaeon]|nr:VWA domain-containing protein [Candidatus Woesearchaeota archaeon]